MANVKFTITGDNSSAMRAMAQVKGAMSGVASYVGGPLKAAMASAFSVAAVSEVVRRTLDYADSIDEASSRIGVGTERLQEYTFAAKQSGAAMEDIVGFAEKLNVKAASNPDLLKKYGIDPNQTPEQLLESVWKKTQGKSSGEVTPMLQAIGGKSGGKLFNTFQNDLDAVSKSAREFGAVMDTTTTVQLAALNDQLSIITQIIYSNVGPALVRLAQWALEVYYKSKGWFTKEFATKMLTSGATETGDLIKQSALYGLTGGVAGGKTEKEYNAEVAALDAKRAKVGLVNSPDGDTSTNAIRNKIDQETDASIEAIQAAMDRAIENDWLRRNRKIVPGDSNAKAQSMSQLTAPSSMVSIGGIAGVNIQYRIARINEDMLTALKQIEKNTDGDDSDEPNSFSGK